MDRRRFDALTRALGAARSRRNALTAVLAGLLGLGSLTAADPADRDRDSKRHNRKHKRHRDRERAIAVEGPCGDGSGPHNRCKKNRDCCTRHCNRKQGRCRCLRQGQACTHDRPCCPARTGRTCLGGSCQTVSTACEETCTGCCDSEGACQPGTDPGACGSGGGPCRSIVESERVELGASQPTGTPPVAPTPVPPTPVLTCADTCTGCCDSTGGCRNGSAHGACGGGGQPCQACGATEACEQGACQPECPPAPA